MAIEVLGPIRVVRDDAVVEVRGEQQRKLLAVLAAAGATGRSTGALIEDLWGDTPPSDPSATLRTYLSRVRRVVGDDAIQTRTARYLLQTGPEHLDADEFERLLREGSDDRDPAVAAATLGRALGLWRGDAYGEFADHDAVYPDARRLEELRLTAEEQWLRARLDAGESSAVVGDAELAVGRRPLDDGVRAALMLALHRSGRQADALRCFQDASEALADVGLTPSSDLVELEQRIAQSDPALSATPTLATSPGYELLEKLGEGASAIVYRAIQTSVGREVAIKRIRPELANQPDFIRRFEAEARLVASLEHPNIVPLYDFWREPGAAYLAMRLLRGGSVLDAWTNGPSDLAHVVDIATQIGAALTTAHQAGIVHRDVKAANILLDSDGTAYLADFGIAMSWDDAKPGPSPSWEGSLAYASPEQIRGEPVGPRADIYGLAVVVFEALTGMVPFGDSADRASLTTRKLSDAIPPVSSIRPGLPSDLDRVLATATATNPADRYADAAEFTAALTAAVSDSHTAPVSAFTVVHGDVKNPYKGLRAFQEADSADFVGRAALVDRLVGACAEHRLLTVVGPSGSGKSSAVNAGLLPALREGGVMGSDRWFVASMTPGRNPFDELEAALLAVATERPAQLLDQLMSGERGIARTLRRLQPEAGATFLLVIDQCEELWTLSSADDRVRFLDALVEAVTEERSRLRVVMTLRADYYDGPLRHSGLGALVRDGSVPVLPLDPAELEAAVIEPAARVGVAFEPGLVSRIVSDVGSQAGALPLVQYALTLLFDRRVANTMMRSAYDDFGGIAGALAGHAESIYSDLPDADQHRTRNLFGRMVALGEGGETTRRRALRSEFEADEVVERFGAARLLSFDHDSRTRERTVEVAHEALLSSWPRLREWIDTDRDKLRLARHLRAATDSWLASDRDDDELYRGARLETAEEWAASDPDVASEQDNAFLEASGARRDIEEEREHGRVQRLRRALVSVAAVAAVALVASLLALLQRQESQRQRDLAQANAATAEQNALRASASAATAEKNALAAEQAGTAAESSAAEAAVERDRAEARRMVAEAVDLVDSDPSLALLVAAEAQRFAPGPTALGSLQRVLTALPRGWLTTIAPREGQMLDAAFLDDDRLVVVDGAGAHVASIDDQTQSVPLSFEAPVAVAASSDGSTLLLVSADRWQLFDGADLRALATGRVDGDVTAAAVNSSGGAFALGFADGRLALIERNGTGSWTGSIEPSRSGSAVEEIAFDPSETLLAASVEGFGGGVKLWETMSGDVVAAGLTAGVVETISGAAAFGWGGETLWVSQFNQLSGYSAAASWNEVSAAQLPLDIGSGEMLGVGDLVVAAPPGGELMAVDASGPSILGIDSPVAGVLELAASPSGRQLAVVTNAGVAVHRLDGSGNIAIGRYEGVGDNLDIDESGSRLLQHDTGRRQSAQIIDLTETNAVPLDLSGPDGGGIWGSPSNDENAFFLYGFGADDESITAIWEDGEIRSVPFPFDAGYGGMALSTADRYLILGHVRQNRIDVWDIDSGQSIAELNIVIETETVKPALAYASGIETALDGSYVVVATTAETVHRFETANWTEIGEMIGSADGFRDLVFSPDGKTAATVSSRGLEIRDAASLEVLRGPTTNIPNELAIGGQWVDYVLDGRYVVVNGGPGGSQMVDAETLEAVGEPFRMDTAFRQGAVARHANILATYVDGETVIWDLNVDRWPEMACRAARRNMTEEEWTRFGPAGADRRDTCPESPGSR